MNIKLKDIWKISNLLSLYRLFLAFIIPILWIKNVKIQIIIVLLISGAISDTLDGTIARLFHQKTDLGKILDPIADKFFINMFFCLLYINKLISLYLFLIIILRDILILSGGIYLFIKFSDKINLKPTILGKISTVFQVSFLILYFFYIFIFKFPQFIIYIIEVGVIFFTIVSGLSYGILFFNYLKLHQSNKNFPVL
ncbi:MAG: hypothetical protein DRP29_03995 [Thermodesulfobacteriota bacterium]|nr:MAG: hypothetical protein DRP29_03995 [Thermodesulfobacteriota bacterium]